MTPLPRIETHIATLDVCLAGVFIGRGDRIPDDLLPVWHRRLIALGLETPPPDPTPVLDRAP